MTQLLFTMDYLEGVELSKDSFITKDISIGDANWEIVDVLIDKYEAGNPTISITQKKVLTYYKWNVGFFNAGNDLAKIKLKLLVMHHPQPILP